MSVYRENALKRWNKDLGLNLNVNHQFFTNPQTPESCYCLGFIWADGYLYQPTNKISLELITDDIEDIKHLFLLSGKWHLTSRIRKNRKSQSCLSANNRFLFDFLKDNDYLTKSQASPTKILSVIPDNLKHYWWRGFFDGDGCWYANQKYYVFQAQLAGSYNQDWASAEELCKSLDIKYSLSRRQQGENYSSCIRICGQNAKIFGRYIYRDWNFIGLNRKYCKYLLNL